jgi:hypothetical protein
MNAKPVPLHAGRGSCICDICGCETPSLIMGGLVAGGGKGRCRSCFDKKERGEEKDCSNCLHRCMDMSMDPYCSAVNTPFGISLFSGKPKACGPESKLWEKDTRR